MFRKGEESKHHEGTPQERKASKHVRRLENEAAQVPTKTGCVDPGRAPGYFRPQLGFLSFFLASLGPY